MRRAETALQICAIPIILILVHKVNNGMLHTSRPLLFIGKISFSIYAVHWPVLKVFEKIDMQFFFEIPLNKVAITLLIEGIVIVAGSIVYFMLERPSQLLARKFLTNLRNRFDHI
jgi:peptidoglycan/LPS O-acetylase OafA/YrhL